MQDVLIIPSFQRPEMLRLCLEHIAQARGAEDLDILLAVDAHYRQMPPMKEHVQVVNLFPTLQIRWRVLKPHRFMGNSYNVLMAYKQVLEQDNPDRVFMIEDDVMIAPSFFEWHRAVEGLHATASVGVGPTSHGNYASLGVCLPRGFLKEVVAHATSEYFLRMERYCKHKFPPSAFGYEQDGLIARIIGPRRVVFADPPVAQHVGWYGYHRSKSLQPHGNLDERYQIVRRVLSDEAILTSWERDFGDVKPLL